MSQARGLLQALGRRLDFRLVEIDVRDPRAVAAAAAGGGRSPASPPPLLLAAGSRTHAPALRARAGGGGFATVLMNPVWPTGHRKRGFDLIVAPEHDGLRPGPDVLLTVGALNPLTDAGRHEPHRGVLLVGGPSKRYRWDGPATLDRLREVVRRTDRVTDWRATSSRRTPAGAEHGLSGLHPRVAFTPAADTPRGWVAEQLAAADVAWVTEDSVSMIYEALTAGCRVGLLPLRRVPGLGERFLGWGANRVAAGTQRLIDRGRVVPFDAWAAGRPLTRPDPPLAEADRAAREVLRRWRATWPTALRA